MKQIFLFATLAVTFAACGNNNTAEKAAAPATDMAAETKNEAPADPNAPKDPVCGMDKMADWDQYSVHNGDTTWFCSPHCKETFDKDPAKFAKK